MMERKFTQQGKRVIVLVKCIINFFVYRICSFLSRKQKSLKMENLVIILHLRDILYRSFHSAHTFRTWCWLELSGQVDSSGKTQQIPMLAESPTILIVLVVKWSSRTGQTTAIKFTPEKALVTPREISRIQTGKVQNTFFKRATAIMNELCRLVFTSCPYNHELHSTNADLQCKSQIGLSKL